MSRDDEYTEPGQIDRSYTVSGFFSPDDPNPLVVPPTESVLMTVNYTRSRYRSAAWWLSAWMPKSWRRALCRRYGHPASCLRATLTQSVMASRPNVGPDGEVTYDIVPTGDYALSERTCERCGATENV